MSIPKTIHYCWFGHGEIPERDRRCIESWSRFCPDYQIIQWNEDNYDVTQIPYMKEAYEAKRWAFVSDYARMDVVYRHGGIYLDTDVELLRPLDDLLGYAGYAGVEAGLGCVSLGLGFGAEKGMPLLRELCDYYKTLHFIDQEGKPILLPNPQIVTEYIEGKGYTIPDDRPFVVDGMTVLPPEYLCPQSYETGRLHVTEKTYSIHHYHASWQTEQEKKQLCEYRRYTRLFGEHFGELVYQFHRVWKAEGLASSMKKAAGYLKREKHEED